MHCRLLSPAPRSVQNLLICKRSSTSTLLALRCRRSSCCGSAPASATCTRRRPTTGKSAAHKCRIAMACLFLPAGLFRACVACLWVGRRHRAAPPATAPARSLQPQQHSLHNASHRLLRYPFPPRFRQAFGRRLPGAPDGQWRDAAGRGRQGQAVCCRAARNGARSGRAGSVESRSGLMMLAAAS